MKIKTGKELDMTIETCTAKMKQESISQFRKAGVSIYAKGYYMRGRCYGRPVDGGRPGHVDIYYLDAAGTIETLCYNTTRHRGIVLLHALENGTINNVTGNILDNYSTNGYSTRRGLFRSNKNEAKINRIAASHANYMGRESGNSSYDHSRRAAMRN